MSNARAALFSCCLALTGCGAAVSNEAWLREPEPGTLTAAESLSVEHDASLAVATPGTVSDAAPRTGPQRLDRTITLGAVEATPPSTVPSAPGAAPTTVVVNVNNYGAPAYAPYGGYYGAFPVARSERGAHSPSHAVQSTPAPVIPGQNWPAAPSYGPSFPYSTSPASPWETKR